MIRIHFGAFFKCEKGTLAVLAGSSSDKAYPKIRYEAKLAASALDGFCSKKEALK